MLRCDLQHVSFTRDGVDIGWMKHLVTIDNPYAAGRFVHQR